MQIKRLIPIVGMLLGASAVSAAVPTIAPSQDVAQAAMDREAATTSKKKALRPSGRALSAPLLTQVGTFSQGGLAAQAFEAAESVYDSEAADDFITPSGESWLLQEVRIVGLSAAPSPAVQSATLRIWTNTGATSADWLPGTVVCEWQAVAAVESPLGDVRVKLPTGCTLAGSTRYWLSAQMSQTFNSTLGGQYWWSEQTEATGDAGFAWRNPGNGFGTSCTSWTRAATCGVTTPGSNNLRFQLFGRGVKGDLMGDGYSDLVYQNAASHRVVTWSMEGDNRLNGDLIVPDIGTGNWVQRGVGDLDGDRKSDLVWQNTDSSTIVIWFMNGRTRITGAAVSPVPTPGLQFEVVGTGDMGTTSANTALDGKDDILMRNTGTGDLVFWLMNGATRVDGGFLLGPAGGDPITADPLSWKPVGMGDFDNDNYADVLWIKPSTLELRIWKLVNRVVVSSCATNPTFQTGGFNPFAVGDVGANVLGGRDGKADIVFIRSTGEQLTWYMNGCNQVTGGVPPTVSTFPSGWTAVGVR